MSVCWGGCYWDGFCTFWWSEKQSQMLSEARQTNNKSKFPRCSAKEWKAKLDLSQGSARSLWGGWLHVVSLVLTCSSARVAASTSPCDWTGACRAPCCGRTCRFPGPRSRPWRRDAPPGWPLSGDGHQTLAPGSCRTEARPGNAPGGSLERTCPPAEQSKELGVT